MSRSSRFELSGRNYTLIHLCESFVESCQTLRVALPNGLIILLEVLPFPKVLQSSRQQEVRVKVFNESENDFLLVVNFGKSKKPNKSHILLSYWSPRSFKTVCGRKLNFFLGFLFTL